MGFELRALSLLGRYSTMPAALSYLSNRVLHFFAASDHDPPTYASLKASIIGGHHHAWLTLFFKGTEQVCKIYLFGEVIYTYYIYIESIC
jgi:hypothetical protein